MKCQSTHASLLKRLNKFDETRRNTSGDFVTESFFGLYECDHEFVFFFQAYLAAVRSSQFVGQVFCNLIYRYKYIFLWQHYFSQFVWLLIYNEKHTRTTLSMSSWGSLGSSSAG